MGKSEKNSVVSGASDEENEPHTGGFKNFLLKMLRDKNPQKLEVWFLLGHTMLDIHVSESMGWPFKSNILRECTKVVL